MMKKAVVLCALSTMGAMAGKPEEPKTPPTPPTVSTMKDLDECKGLDNSKDNFDGVCGKWVEAKDAYPKVWMGISAGLSLLTVAGWGMYCKERTR